MNCYFLYQHMNCSFKTSVKGVKFNERYREILISIVKLNLLTVHTLTAFVMLAILSL